MEKKIAKGQEQADKKIEKKTYNGDFFRKVKDGVNRPNQFAVSKRNLLDRGDSKKLKIEEVQIKYDGNKINKAIEANLKTTKQSTNSVNKHEAQTKKNDSKIQTNSTDAENDTNFFKSQANSTNLEKDAKAKVRDNLRMVEGKPAGGKLILEKGTLPQSSAGRSVTDRESRNKTKVKEVITIPCILDDDHEQDADDSVPLKVERSAKSKSSGVKQKAVTFNERSERSPKIGKRESKRPDAKTTWLKTQNTGNKRRRKPTSPSPVKSTNDSLATEVVKWSPSSVNNHTKPYYDAWVDRSLTAFSKCSEKERLKLEKEIIETLEHFKRPVSPELMYERINDETYTGRIKVRRG